MAIFHYISVLVPTTLAVATPYVLKKNGFDNEKKYRWILYVACLLFFISWYLPSPLIDGQDTSFTTHFVGGGLFTGLFWVYLVFVDEMASALAGDGVFSLRFSFGAWLH